jgi:colicin import membrane protein
MSGSEDVTPVQIPVPRPEPDEAPETPEPPVKPPKNGRARRVSAYIGAAVTAAVAAYGAVKPEAEGERAQAQVEASYEALSQDVTRLQRWAQANRARAQAAEATCRAEVAALQAFTSGFLLGQSRVRGGRRPAGGAHAAPEAVEALVRALKTREKAAQAKMRDK